MNEQAVRTFRVYLVLSEFEALALARIARSEMRDLRTQAHFLLRSKLVDLGMLHEASPDPVTPLAKSIS